MKQIILILLILGFISCDIEEAFNNDDEDRDRHSEHSDYDEDIIGPRTCVITFIADGTAEEAICIEANTGFESEDCQRVSTDMLTSSTSGARLSQYSIAFSSVSSCAPALNLNDGTDTNSINHSGFCGASYDGNNIKMFFYGIMVFGNTINNETDCTNLFSATYTNP